MRRSWPLVNSVCLWRSPISKLLALRALFIVRPNYYRRVTVTDRLESKKSTRTATQENRNYSNHFTYLRLAESAKTHNRDEIRFNTYLLTYLNSV